ncbi:GNAT family N-acetyltransferase [Frondihabitans australicus]|uniref:Putative acetyltransferase n=1 Tax=Frondihabitans australicus TaxID=386892 RepID=A0A495IKU8_9MICO|nr:GNAT family N-acetyltransferase [Frondihabitans australicus]RKR76058.1 putative acetyltransferase [Frondihabitans australicus]
MPVTLRAYDPSKGDAEATLAVFRRAIRLTASSAYTPEQVEAWATVVDLDPPQWAIRRERAETVVALAGDDTVIGFSDTDQHGYIDMMFVDPSVGRQGVATALLAEVTRRAHGHHAVELTTHASLIARPFFERHGFVFVEELRPAPQGVAMPSFALRKPL